MARGGARANSGPPPDPTAIRRDRPSDQATWVVLPEPRQGPPPPWPLTESTKREDAMWVRLWGTRQAVLWEANGWQDEVALYVRNFCKASELDGSNDARTLALRQMEGLGLSGAGLARLHWRLTPLDELAPRKGARSSDARRASAKARYTVIEGGPAAEAV